MVNNLKSISKFAAIGLLATTIYSVSAALPSAAFARSGGQDAAYDKSGSTVRDKWGKCVRTKWDGDNDPCATKAPPPPPPAPPKPVVTPPAPKPAPAPAPEPKVELDQRTVHFAFDSSKLDLTATGKLDALAKLINDSKQIGDVSVVGYTDQMGTDAYNIALAKKRVHAVQEYLDARSRLDSKAADIRAVGKAPADQMCAKLKEEANAEQAAASKGKKGKKGKKAKQAAAAKLKGKHRNALIDCMKNERRVEIELKYVK